jgi:hypothetical protein
MYRLIFAALVFLLFVPVSAAFAFDVGDAKDAFAVDVGELVDDATSKLAEAKEDLQQCSVTYEMCLRDVPRCLGTFTRCGGKANKTADRICSGFLKKFRKAYKDASGSLSKADRRLFDDDPNVKAKVDIARAFASGCAGSEDAPDAPSLDPFAKAYVCDTALCSNNGSPVLQGECVSAVEACQDYAGEELETCVSLGLFICRGAVLPEEPPAEPSATPTATPTGEPTGIPTATPTGEPTGTPTPTPTPTITPGDDQNVCNQKLCALSPNRAKKCRVFFAACVDNTVRDDECLGAALAYCNFNADFH